MSTRKIILTRVQKQVIFILKSWEDVWRLYSALQAELNIRRIFIDVSDLKIVMKELKELEFVTLCSLWQDGMVAGRGYFLTRKGWLNDEL